HEINSDVKEIKQTLRMKAHGEDRDLGHDTNNNNDNNPDSSAAISPSIPAARMPIIRAEEDELDIDKELNEIDDSIPFYTPKGLGLLTDSSELKESSATSLIEVV